MLPMMMTLLVEIPRSMMGPVMTTNIANNDKPALHETQYYIDPQDNMSPTRQRKMDRKHP